MVHTCPRCELRFMTETELQHHLGSDHQVDPSTLERFQYRPKAPPSPIRRYLVVANQTLNDEGLFKRIKTLAAETDSRFRVLAPATPSGGYGTSPAADDKGVALATRRVSQFVKRLHEAGIEAEGEVGDPEPVKAVARALEHEPADEIIVSTRAAGLSKWLAVDVPKHLEHTFHLPVKVLRAET